MRKTLALLLLVPVLAVPFVGCSDGRKIPTPAACQTAPEFWLTALADAPDQVLIDGATPISECLPPDQAAAHQEEVGKTAVDAATTLAASYKRNTGQGVESTPTADEAALMAGYLVGALEKAAEETEGIHATLVQRVEAAATNGLDQAGEPARDEYRTGYEAGRQDG